MERLEWQRSGDKGVGVVKCHAPHVLATRPERAEAPSPGHRPG